MTGIIAMVVTPRDQFSKQLCTVSGCPIDGAACSGEVTPQGYYSQWSCDRDLTHQVAVLSSMLYKAQLKQYSGSWEVGLFKQDPPYDQLPHWSQSCLVFCPVQRLRHSVGVSFWRHDLASVSRSGWQATFLPSSCFRMQSPVTGCLNTNCLASGMLGSPLFRIRLG